MLALAGVPNSVLLATHTGLDRSADSGGLFQQKIAAGSGQAMDGLMVAKLAQSPVDPQRVYALAVLRKTGEHANGSPGIYVSSDTGKTWTPTATTSSHPRLVTVDPQNASVSYVGFSYPLGVAISTDAGSPLEERTTVTVASRSGHVTGESVVHRSTAQDGAGSIARSVYASASSARREASSRPVSSGRTVVSLGGNSCNAPSRLRA